MTHRSPQPPPPAAGGRCGGCRTTSTRPRSATWSSGELCIIGIWKMDIKLSRVVPKYQHIPAPKCSGSNRLLVDEQPTGRFELPTYSILSRPLIFRSIQHKFIASSPIIILRLPTNGCLYKQKIARSCRAEVSPGNNFLRWLR